jgi:CRP-like cAMP-binding protein
VSEAPIRKTVQVINQLPSMSSFGFEPDSGEQVFIGSRLSKMQDICEGDEVEVFVRPNTHSDNVEWFAIYVRKLGQAEVAPPETPHALRNPICRFLEDGPATTRQIADHMGITTADASRRLGQLHDAGTIARAGIRKCSDQARDSYVVWALSADDMLPQEEEDCVENA